MVRETAPLPEWNPQAEFISAEENSRFQSIFADGTCLFLQLYQLVEILISTKCVDKVDAFKKRTLKGTLLVYYNCPSRTSFAFVKASVIFEASFPPA